MCVCVWGRAEVLLHHGSKEVEGKRRMGNAKRSDRDVRKNLSENEGIMGLVVHGGNAREAAKHHFFFYRRRVRQTNEDGGMITNESVSGWEGCKIWDESRKKEE